MNIIYLSKIALWFKDSIVGIIFLGALGSIIGYYVLKILSWTFRKLLHNNLHKILFSAIKPYLVNEYMREKYLEDKNYHMIITNILRCQCDLIRTTIAYFAILIILILYILIAKIKIAILIGLLSILFLNMIYIFRSFASYYGALGDDLFEQEKSIKRNMKITFKKSKNKQMSDN